MKVRQSAKIQQLGQALIGAGLRTLDAQADALDLRRSTAFRIPCAGSLTRSAFTALPGSRRNFLVGSLGAAETVSASG
jgi:hypothetical protein